MKNVLYLFGPTLTIYLGLSFFESIPITFLLFYGWLFFIPLTSYIKYFRRKESFLQSFRQGFRLSPILSGLLSGIICLMSIFGAIILFEGQLFEVDHISVVLNEWGFSGTKVWGFIFVLIFINPFLEEWYWREFMHVRLHALISAPMAVIVTSFFYSLYHLLVLIPLFALPFSLIATIPVFIAGLLWGYFRVFFTSITPTVISHTLADLGIVLSYLYFFM